MLRGLSSVFSFLTIMPVSNSGLETGARHMHLFPLVGIALGLLVCFLVGVIRKMGAYTMGEKKQTVRMRCRRCRAGYTMYTDQYFDGEGQGWTG